MTVRADRPVRRRVVRSRRSGAGDRRWPLARMLAVSASVLAVIMLSAIVAGALALSRLTDTGTTLVDVAGPALVNAQQLSAALVDQETGVRGFGLSGRGEFLEPYRNGLADERAAAGRLRGLAERGLGDDVTRQLDATRQAAREWRSGYAEPVLAGAAPDPVAGRVLFDRVRSANQDLIADLTAHRTVARTGFGNASGSLAGVGAVIAAVLLATLVLAAIGMRRAVLRPISVLAGQVRHVVSTDVAQPVEVDGPREIVELGEDVEAMRRHILDDLATTQLARNRLDDQARDLERSNRDLEQFAYVASHDLQEPLRKVSSFCQLLQRRYGGQLDERADQYIEFAVDGAQRMQRLINDLLAFSRVGRNTEAFGQVDLAGVVAAAAAALDATRTELSGEIVLGELPVVHGDRALLQQLFVNLVGNALKFHREGVPPVVRVDAVRTDAGWEVTVADNGIGVEAEYADKVFVIFQRLHGRDRYPGTGIGLALAKKIVEFHDGRIAFDPVAGPGSTVRVTLPVQGEEQPP